MMSALEKNNRAAEMEKQRQQIKDCLEKVKYKIAVCSGKGGVGKTTVAVNLAVALAKEGLKVGILDVDITGPNVPKVLDLLGQRPEVNVDSGKFRPVVGPEGIKVMSMAFLLESADTPVIWRGPMKMSAIRQFLAEGDWGELDYLIADLPPGTSDELLDVLQLMEDAKVIVVTTPNEVALNVSRKALSMAKQMKRDVLGIIENMAGMEIVCPKCKEKIHVDVFGSGGGMQAAMDFDVNFLGAVPLNAELREMADKGMPIVLKDKNAVSSKVFHDIILKIRKEMEK
jgi:Mrp family chromosome partitioning ATPase